MCSFEGSAAEHHYVLYNCICVLPINMRHVRHAENKNALAHLISIQGVVNQLRDTHGAVVRQRVAEGDDARKSTRLQAQGRQGQKHSCRAPHSSSDTLHYVPIQSHKTVGRV